MTEHDDSPELDPVMDPAASPRRPGHGVRRVNNVPMLIVGGIVLFFAGVIAYVAVGRASPGAAQRGEGDLRSARSVAEEITRPYEAGEIEAAGGQPGPATPPDQIPEAATAAAAEPTTAGLPPNFPAPPTPPQGAGGLSPPLSAQADRTGSGGPGGTGASLQSAQSTEERELSQMRLEMFKSALRSATRVDIEDAAARRGGDRAGQGAGGTRGSHVTARDDFGERLEQLKAAGLLPETAGQGATARNSYARFEGSGDEDRWQSGGRLEAPGSAYELRAGAVLPATLVTGINSDLPGQITALLAQDVRDTATGEHVLIPQASRLIGTYGAEVKFGQERVLVAWQRIVYPDGKALDIGAMPGADGAGYAGFADQVDNHYFRLFASAVLMSGITAGITISQDSAGDESGRVSMNGAMTEALGQQLGQLSEELIRRQMDVAPTIEIRPGYRFNVQVTKDLTFNAPYQAFDYDRSISTGERTFRMGR